MVYIIEGKKGSQEVSWLNLPKLKTKKGALDFGKVLKEDGRFTNLKLYKLSSGNFKSGFNSKFIKKL